MSFCNNGVKDVIKADKGELSVLEEQVIKSLKEQELLSTIFVYARVLATAGYASLLPK